MSAPTRGRLVRPAVTAVLLLLLTGCVSVPSTGRVVAGGDVNQQGVRSALRVTASGPAADADERQIVEGFLTAVAGLDDYAVAREFLAPGADDWRPGQQTVVYEGVPTFAPTLSDDDGASVVVRADVVGRIDESGRYAEQTAVVQELEFGLVRVDDEWRIDDLPPGVLVSVVDRDRVLAPFGVYFTDPTETYLVPDVRWFPQLTSSATPLVRALLGGPSAPYLSALQSAAPTGTRLDLQTVPVENGVATVDLTDDVLQADGGSRAVLLAQLRQTLRSVPGVSSVRVTVDGAQLEEPPSSDVVGAPTLVVDPSVNARPVVLAPPDVAPGEAEVDGAPTQDGGTSGPGGSGAAQPSTQPSTAEGGAATEPEPDTGAEEPSPEEPTAEPRPEPLIGPGGRPLAPEGSSVQRLDLDGATTVEGTAAFAERVATGLAVTTDGSTFAGLDASRGSLLLLQQPGSSVVELATGTMLTTPSFDPPPLSWVWTVSAGDPEGPRAPTVLAAASSVEQVEARWLAAGDQVRALRVSRDGARVVVVLARGDGSVGVQVHGVRRDGTGRPLSLSQAAFVIAPELVDAVDAAWVNDDTVVVLGRSGEESIRPLLAQVGGMTEALAPTPGAVSVSAALGARTIVVGTVDGTVLRRSGSLWLDGPFGVSPAHGG